MFSPSSDSALFQISSASLVGSCWVFVSERVGYAGGQLYVTASSN